MTLNISKFRGIKPSDLKDTLLSDEDEIFEITDILSNTPTEALKIIEELHNTNFIKDEKWWKNAFEKSKQYVIIAEAISDIKSYAPKRLNSYGKYEFKEKDFLKPIIEYHCSYPHSTFRTRENILQYFEIDDLHIDLCLHYLEPRNHIAPFYSLPLKTDNSKYLYGKINAYFMNSLTCYHMGVPSPEMPFSISVQKYLINHAKDVCFTPVIFCNDSKKYKELFNGVIKTELFEHDKVKGMFLSDMLTGKHKGKEREKIIEFKNHILELNDINPMFIVNPTRYAISQFSASMMEGIKEIKTPEEEKECFNVFNKYLETGIFTEETIYTGLWYLEKALKNHTINTQISTTLAFLIDKFDWSPKIEKKIGELFYTAVATDMKTQQIEKSTWYKMIEKLQAHKHYSYALYGILDAYNNHPAKPYYIDFCKKAITGQTLTNPQIHLILTAGLDKSTALVEHMFKTCDISRGFTNVNMNEFKMLEEKMSKSDYKKSILSYYFKNTFNTLQRVKKTNFNAEELKYINISMLLHLLHGTSPKHDLIIISPDNNKTKDIINSSLKTALPFIETIQTDIRMQCFQNYVDVACDNGNIFDKMPFVETNTNVFYLMHDMIKDNCRINCKKILSNEVEYEDIKNFFRILPSETVEYFKCQIRTQAENFTDVEKIRFGNNVIVLQQAIKDVVYEIKPRVRELDEDAFER